MKITFEHYRMDRQGDLRRYYQGNSDWKPLEKGGMTICRIHNGNEKVIGIGIARCSQSDAFSYRLGRQISYRRAYKNVRATS